MGEKVGRLHMSLSASQFPRNGQPNIEKVVELSLLVDKTNEC
jgi:hypothetical protein